MFLRLFPLNEEYRSGSDVPRGKRVGPLGTHKCVRVRIVLGSKDRKQHRSESEGLGRNAWEHYDIEREQLGIRRNPYWPLNGPSFLPVLRIHQCISPHCSRKRRQLRPKSCGADGKPTTELFMEVKVNLGALPANFELSSEWCKRDTKPIQAKRRQ